MARRILLAGVALVTVTGCAEAPRRPTRSAPLPADLAAWVSASEPGRATRNVAAAPARIADDGPDARFTTRRITPVAEAAPRPMRQGRADVSFQGAEMIHAFQFLADAGRFNLVMAEGLNGKVTATLRGVDPYDALVSLAEANGATVRFDRGIVVVSKR